MGSDEQRKIDGKCVRCQTRCAALGSQVCVRGNNWLLDARSMSAPEDPSTHSAHNQTNKTDNKHVCVCVFVCYSRHKCINITQIRFLITVLFIETTHSLKQLKSSPT